VRLPFLKQLTGFHEMWYDGYTAADQNSSHPDLVVCPFVLCLFFFNASSQYTLVSNLCHLIFGLMFFGWLQSIMLTTYCWWVNYFLFMPTSSWIQLGHKTRAGYIKFRTSDMQTQVTSTSYSHFMQKINKMCKMKGTYHVVKI